MPHVKIVFDLFHVVSGLVKLLTRYEMLNTKKRRKRTRTSSKGSKYLLLKTNEIFAGKHQEHLKQLLSLNETINTVLILKDKLKHI
ncbi:MAG: transposase [Planctomycetia bacterium]|nr:transposase [Planctomycetia bacterium]